jgi:hypothetical protein
MAKAAQPCIGDIDDDGQVTVSEVVRAVRSALENCGASAPAAGASLSTNGVRFRNGDTIEVTLEVTSTEPATWWSWYGVGADECRFQVTVGSAGAAPQFDLWADPSWRAGCIGIGGPFRQNVFTTPPRKVFTASFPLRGNSGDASGRNIEPGFYLLEAIAFVGRSSDDGSPTGVLQELRSGMIIEIVE